MTSQKTVGLVLGSGSSRGWAHIGVIEALQEAAVPIDFIVGCSIGAYVGALHACGSLQSLKAFVLKMDGQKIFSYFDIVFPHSGLLDGAKRLKELFSMHTHVQDFSELSIPVMMVATELFTGGKVVLKSGNLLQALRATMSMPGLFAPARVNGRWLVDGGVVDPVPVGVARAYGADVVIAVDLNSVLLTRTHRKKAQPANDISSNHHALKNAFLQKMADYYANAELTFKQKISELFRQESGKPDIIETVMTSIGIMQARITNINLAVEPPDILLQPRLSKLKMLDFDHVEDTIEEGYLICKEKIEDILDLLQ